LLVVAVIPSLVNLTYQKFYADDPLITYTTWRYDGDDWMPYIDFRPGGDLATHVDYDKEKSYGGHWSQSGNRIRFEINYGETYRNEQEVTVSGDQMSGTASAPTGLPWWHPLHRGSSKEIKLHRLDPRSVSTDAPSLAGTTWAIGGVGESGAIGFLAGGKFQDLGGNWTQDGRYVKFEVDKDGVVDKYTVAVSGDRMHGDVEHSGKVVGGGRALLFRVKRSDVQ